MTSNIIFIVADDLNAWIGPLGRHPNVKTPNIDRLAQRGTVFTQAYCAAPYCNASRMSVFSACLPTTTGIYANEPFWEEPLRRLTAVEHIRALGYHCFGAGKVFHGNFDYAKATRDKQTGAEWRDTQNRAAVWDEFHSNIGDPMPPLRPLNGMFDFSDFESVSPWNHLFDWGVLPAEREAEMPDSLTVSRVVDFLRNPPDKPFLCACGFYKPHLPWYVPKRFFEMYKPEDIALPFVKQDDLEDVPPIADWALNPPDHETMLKHGQWRNAVHSYLAAISYCDEQIGAVIDAAQASPNADNTIIVLWGDNGFHLGEKLHWRKFVLWEEATRVPMIIVSPRKRTEPRVDIPVSLMDMWPTLLDLADLAPMPNVDGTSLVDVMAGGKAPCARPATMTWLPGNHSLRSGQWRYTRYKDGTEELYDQQSDPYEWANLIGDDQFSEHRTRLSDQLSSALAGAPSRDFFTIHNRFLHTSIVGNWPERLNARYEAIIGANRAALNGARVLDIASHDGRWTFASIEAGAAHVTGIEVRQELIDSATENLTGLGASPDRFRFIRADVFERPDIFDEQYDVVLCLGFIYHTSRHIELIELMQRTKARTIIIDTIVANAAGAFMTLLSEASDHPANGLDKTAVRDGRILVGHPSPDGLILMLKHFRYSVTRFDWSGLIRQQGLSPDESEPHSASNPIADYHRGDRETFVATL